MKIGSHMARNGKKAIQSTSTDIPSMSRVSLPWNDGDPFRATGFIGNTLVTGSAQIGITFHRLAVASRLGRLIHHQDKFTKQALPELCHHLPRNVTGNPWWQIHRMHFSMTAANLECLATTPQNAQE